MSLFQETTFKTSLDPEVAEELDACSGDTDFHRVSPTTKFGKIDEAIYSSAPPRQRGASLVGAVLGTLGVSDSTQSPPPPLSSQSSSPPSGHFRRDQGAPPAASPRSDRNANNFNFGDRPVGAASRASEGDVSEPNWAQRTDTVQLSFCPPSEPDEALEEDYADFELQVKCLDTNETHVVSKASMGVADLTYDEKMRLRGPGVVVSETLIRRASQGHVDTQSDGP